MSVRSSRQKALVATAVVGLVAIAAWWGFSEDAPSPGDDSGLVSTSTPATGEAVDPTIDGYVIDRTTGLSLSSATVTLQCQVEETAMEPVPQKVDDTGAFLFDVPPEATRCSLTASGAGYVASDGDDGRSVAEVALHDELGVQGVQLSLVPASKLEGVVYVGQSDDGLADCVFTVLYLEAPGRSEPFTVESEAVSGEDGRFSIGGLGPGRVQILAEHRDHALAESSPMFIKAGEDLSGVVLRLASGGTLTGQVVDEAGEPILGATVAAFVGGSKRARHRATVDDEGRFSWEGVEIGKVSVTARALGYRGATASAQVTVSQETTISLTLRRRDGFGGLVVDEQGAPVAGAEILTSDPQSRGRAVARSDHRGSFWVGWTPASGSTVTARHSLYTLSSPVAAPQDGQPITLTVKAGGALRARVMAPDGRPVAVYTASVWPEPGTAGRGQTIRVGDASGVLEVPSLAPGVYTIRVSADGYPPAVSKPQRVVAKETTDAGDIALQGGGQLSGRVIHAETGQPVANARVFLSGARAAGFRRRPPTAVTSADGEFVIRGLPAGRLSLRFVRAGFVTRVESALQVGSGSDGDIGDVSMQPATGDSAGRGRMQYQGVGAVLRRTGDGLMVERVFEGAPAGEAGLVAGTKIQSINGTPVSDLDLRRAVEMIRGEAGSEVKLKVLMPGGTAPEFVHVLRGEVMTPKNNRRRTQRPQR